MSAYLKCVALMAMLSAAGQPAWAAGQSSPDPAGDLTIGGLVRPSEGGRWSLTARGNGYAIDCQGDGCNGQSIDIEIRPLSGAECGEALILQDAMLGQTGSGDIKHMTIARPGFAIEVALPDLGCRNWTGSPVHACTIVAGDLYLFRAGWGGCRGTPPDFERPVLEFLDGLVLAEP